MGNQPGKAGKRHPGTGAVPRPPTGEPDEADVAGASTPADGAGAASAAADGTAATETDITIQESLCTEDEDGDDGKRGMDLSHFDLLKVCPSVTASVACAAGSHSGRPSPGVCPVPCAAAIPRGAGARGSR